MTHQGPGQGQGRDRRAQQRLGTVVVMVGAAAGALTSLGGPAYASDSTAAVVVAPDLHSSAPEAPLPTEQQEIEAFLTAGYTYSDAEQLAALWGSPSVGSAKALAGAKLLAGDTLPLPPSDAC